MGERAVRTGLRRDHAADDARRLAVLPVPRRDRSAALAGHRGGGVALATTRNRGGLIDLPAPRSPRMVMGESPRSTRRLGRMAGAAYLVNVLAGIFSLMVVPSITGGHGNPVATVQTIMARETLYRAGIAVALLCYVEFLLLPLLLYRLLGAVKRNAAALMVVLAAVSVPLSIASLTHKLDVLALLGHAAWLHAFDAGQLQSQVMLPLAGYASDLLLAQVFWGLWLIPFGWLVIRSGQLPRLLGYLLVLGGVSYVADVAGQVLVAGHGDMSFARYVTLPAALGEIGTCLWLLVMGARRGSQPA
ncbi:MAG: DUF4386 family protein [Xanthomonadaceae bacterium]|nr:DUF4386 family protein [Xanthomonadaceae bacterium]